jgi:hypothetical protein
MDIDHPPPRDSSAVSCGSAAKHLLEEDRDVLSVKRSIAAR